MPRSKKGCEAMRKTTRQKIESAALPLFARKGFSVSISQIASAAGLSQGLLYHHFQSKEALIAELARQMVVFLKQIMKDSAKVDVCAAIKIKRITDVMCDMFSDNQAGIDYFMFMAQIGMSGFPIKELVYDVHGLTNPNEALTQIISEGQSEGSVIHGEPEQLAMAYWAMLQGLCCYVLMDMPISPKPEMLLRILLKEKFI